MKGTTPFSPREQEARAQGMISLATADKERKANGVGRLGLRHLGEKKSLAQDTGAVYSDMAEILNQPVVIDNGTGIIKAGFAGADKPKASVLPRFLCNATLDVRNKQAVRSQHTRCLDEFRSCAFLVNEDLV